MDFSCFILEVISPIEDIKPELWETYNLKPISVDTLGDRTWRERNININNAEIACYLEEKAVNIIIATDGSIRDNITAGGGSVWRGYHRVFDWSAGKHGKTSSFRAESEAYEDALVWMTKNTTSVDNIVVLTDSLCLVTRLRSGQVRAHWVELFTKIKASLTTTYIPGHSGIHYNEIVDKHARILYTTVYQLATG